MKKIIFDIFKICWLIIIYIYQLFNGLKLKYKIFILVLLYGLSYGSYKYYEMKEAERYSNDMIQNIMDGDDLEELQEEVLRAS